MERVLDGNTFFHHERRSGVASRQISRISARAQQLRAPGRSAGILDIHYLLTDLSYEDMSPNGFTSATHRMYRPLQRNDPTILVQWSDWTTWTTTMKFNRTWLHCRTNCSTRSLTEVKSPPEKRILRIVCQALEAASFGTPQNMKRAHCSLHGPLVATFSEVSAE